MSKPSFAALLALLCAAAASAAPLYQRPMNGDCVEMGDGSSSSEAQLYPEQYMLVGDEQVKDAFYTEVDSALGFNVKYYPTYKLVNNTIAGEVYVLFQCGADGPSRQLRSSFPAGAKFFTVPLTSISAPETVPYAFLANLGLGDRVHDVSPYVTSPCGQALLECEGRESPDFLVLSNVTLLADTVGGSIDGMLVTSSSEYDKAFTLSAALDPGPLNRAEWIKFVGLFFNREREASTIFDAIKAEYDATKAAAAASVEAKRPVIAWAQHYQYEKDESYQLSFDPYQQQLTEDAGAASLDRDALLAVKGVTSGDAFDPTSPTVSFAWGAEGAFATQAEAKAAFLDALKQADVIIDETYSEAPPEYDAAAMLAVYGISAEEAQSVPAIAAQKVFREDGLLSFDQGMYGLDWFEGAIARPGEVLKDIVRAAQPQAAQGETFTWMRNLFTEKPVVVAGDACITKSTCTAEPATICPFVKLCAAGQPPALLKSTTDGSCAYDECGQPSALGDESPAAAEPAGAGAAAASPEAQAPVPAPVAVPGAAANAAAMAAPAIVLTFVLVAFVEMLMHFC